MSTPTPHDDLAAAGRSALARLDRRCDFDLARLLDAALRDLDASSRGARTAESARRARDLWWRCAAAEGAVLDVAREARRRRRIETDVLASVRHAADRAKRARCLALVEDVYASIPVSSHAKGEPCPR